MEGEQYVPLLKRAFTLWAEDEAASGERLLTLTGGLLIGSAQDVVVAGALASCQAHGLAYEMLDPAQVHSQFPAFTLADGEVALYERDAGVVRPEAAIGAELRLATEAGATVRTGEAVLDWTAGDDGVTVTTAAGELSADRLILAPGAWSPQLTRLDVPLRVHRRIQHYWKPELGLDGFEPGEFPIWMWGYGQGDIAYGMPANDGMVKAAFHHGEDPADPDAGAEPVRDGEIDAMRQWLAPRLPRLGAGEWVGSQPCLYTLTPDEHFVVGPHPRHPERVLVACGFSGHGFKFVPVIGEILADLATAGWTPYDIGLFDPARFNQVSA
jgi:sarcosine oxidase